MTGLSHHVHTIRFPFAAEPEWSSQVERWYQMDAASLALTETFWRHRDKLRNAAPEWMLLASPQGSNVSDSAFALNPPSPAKFVHTLPNIRSAALLQVMEWSGQVLCIQNDPCTILSAMEEGVHLARGASAPVWIASVTGAEASPSEFCGHIFVLSKDGPIKISERRPGARGQSLEHDKHLISWLLGMGRSRCGFLELELER